MKTRSKRQADASGETSGRTEVNTPVAKKIKGIKAVDKPATSKSSKSEHTDEAPKDQNVNGDKANRTSVWLMKSEPDTFSIDDLIKSKDSTSQWDGVRNHEAKNLMKLNMKVDDTILFYHSNTKEPGIVGLAKVAKESYPDYTAFDPKSPYYDAKSTEDDPRWYMVDVKFDRKLRRTITLKEMQIYKDKELKNMRLLNRGRLSVLPVSNDELDFILKIEQEDKAEE